MGTMKTYLAAEKKLVAATLAAYTVRSLGRSEERRVGKECRL